MSFFDMKTFGKTREILQFQKNSELGVNEFFKVSPVGVQNGSEFVTKTPLSW